MRKPKGKGFTSSQIAAERMKSTKKERRAFIAAEKVIRNREAEAKRRARRLQPATV